MNGELLWNRITSELHQKEVELKTLGQGLWFKAYADNSKIYVDKAAEHVPSSKMSMHRPVSKNDFLLVYSYYDRWLSGEIGARHEVSRKSRNTAYIFALINKFYK